MISVLTITKRNGWVPLAVKSLECQTYKDFEWIIVYEPGVEVLEIPEGLNATWVPAPPKTRKSNLNAAMNEGLRHCKGEYVLSYQDFIELEPDTLEKMLKSMGSKTFLTTATVNPDGNKDQRYTGMDGIREIRPPEWEANVGMAPLAILKGLGGYDEEYDNGWSWDNVNVAERAAMLGCKFLIDESINPRLEFHVKEPDADPTIELNYEKHEKTIKAIRQGKKSIRNSYL
jgi:glycosyltransferase involved in cell wall biosynthesis